MRDIEFIPCKRCEFFDGDFNCIIDNRNLYIDFLKEPHCEDFILKGIYNKDDIECILKEKRKMRDPNRLDNFYEKFKTLHKACFPDLRFGQLCSNFFGWLASEHQVDLFFPEEDRMIEYFREYCKKYSRYF